MKQFSTLVNALQDIIAKTFDDGYSQISLTDIRKIAQKALNEHKEGIPKPTLECPRSHVIGEDYCRFTECSNCPVKYKQICAVYNYVWHK